MRRLKSNKHNANTRMYPDDPNKKLLYPELSYKLNGIFFKVHNERGRFLNEKQYSDALEHLFKKEQLKYRREVELPISFEGEQKRRNIADFVIDGKIVIEVKAKPFTTKDDYYQLLRYLSSLNLELGFIVNFRQRYLRPKRIINPNFKR